MEPPRVLKSVLRPALRAITTERGRKLDAKMVGATGHSLYALLFSSVYGTRYHPPMLLTTIGRRTGRRRDIALAYQPIDGGAFAVVGSAGGSPREPEWVRNLRANPVAWVRIARRTIPVRATVLEGAAKQPLWAEICARTPLFAKYEAKAGRDIPVVVLRRYEGTQSSATST